HSRTRSHHRRAAVRLRKGTFGRTTPSVEPKHQGQGARQKRIHGKNEDGGSDDCLRRAAAHSLRASAGRHSVVAADARNYKPINYRLDETHEYVRKSKNLPGIGPVLPEV